jgi:hypothetical protein
LAKFLCNRKLKAGKVYCFAASDCDQEELYEFRSGYGFKTVEDNDEVLAATMLSKAATLVRPILLLCSPFSTEQRSRLNLNVPSLACGQFVYWWADLTIEKQASVTKLLKFAAFTNGNIGILSSAAGLPENFCGGEIMQTELRRLVEITILLVVSVYDGTNYLLCEL